MRCFKSGGLWASSDIWNGLSARIKLLHEVLGQGVPLYWARFHKTLRFILKDEFSLLLIYILTSNFAEQLKLIRSTYSSL